MTVSGIAFEGFVQVKFGQLYLEGDTRFDGDLTAHVAGPNGAGIIGARDGSVVLITGADTAEIPVVITLGTADPGPELADYEDIAEVSLMAHGAHLALVESAGEAAHPLPPLPAGPGSYRVRYHAKGLDSHGDGVGEAYLVQLWPAAMAPPVAVKLTSAAAGFWQGSVAR